MTKVRILIHQQMRNARTNQARVVFICICICICIYISLWIPYCSQHFWIKWFIYSLDARPARLWVWIGTIMTNSPNNQMKTRVLGQRSSLVAIQRTKGRHLSMWLIRVHSIGHLFQNVVSLEEISLHNASSCQAAYPLTYSCIRDEARCNDPSYLLLCENSFCFSWWLKQQSASR